jgi:hypothetical protein
MTPARTFTAWLMKQDTRHDGIGDLARLAVRLDWPDTDGHVDIARRLVDRRASGDRFGQLVAARAAWRETSQRTAHASTCPWCAHVSHATTREDAGVARLEHLRQAHRIRLAFLIAGVVDVAGRIRPDVLGTDGLVHLPPVATLRPDWH